MTLSFHNLHENMYRITFACQILAEGRVDGHMVVVLSLDALPEMVEAKDFLAVVSREPNLVVAHSYYSECQRHLDQAKADWQGSCCQQSLVAPSLAGYRQHEVEMRILLPDTRYFYWKY
jgi:hypothetical protein